MFADHDQIDAAVLSAALRSRVAGDGVVCGVPRSRESFRRETIALNQQLYQFRGARRR